MPRKVLRLVFSGHAGQPCGPPATFLNQRRRRFKGSGGFRFSSYPNPCVCYRRRRCQHRAVVQPAFASVARRPFTWPNRVPAAIPNRQLEDCRRDGQYRMGIYWLQDGPNGRDGSRMQSREALAANGSGRRSIPKTPHSSGRDCHRGISALVAKSGALSPVGMCCHGWSAIPESR